MTDQLRPDDQRDDAPGTDVDERERHEAPADPDSPDEALLTEGADAPDAADIEDPTSQP